MQSLQAPARSNISGRGFSNVDMADLLDDPESQLCECQWRQAAVPVE
jgi:hypothetical protein